MRLSDGHVLLEREADELLVPASNVKLITAAAALQRLSPDFTFKTEIYGRPDAYGRLSQGVGIKGYGDPFLVPERIHHLASRLVVAGVRRIDGDVVVDDSYFTGDRLAYGWQADRSANAYMAPMGALSASFNALAVHILPAAVAGRPARVLLDPPSDYAGVSGRVKTVRAGLLPRRAAPALARRPASGPQALRIDLLPHRRPDLQQGPYDRVVVGGEIKAQAPSRVFWRRVNSPPHYFGELFVRSLAQVGIPVRGRVRTGRVNPTGVQKPLVSFASPRLAELLGPLNKHSNNFVAGQIACALGAHVYGAPGSWEKGRAAMASYLHTQIGLPPQAYTLGNASGLHEVNRFSARHLVQVLKNMHDQPRLWPEFLTSLAVAGGAGTLQERMQQRPTRGLVRGKTGTLAGASALSGVVYDRAGNALGFSLLINGFVHLQDAWRAQDRLALALASLGPQEDILRSAAP